MAHKPPANICGAVERGVKRPDNRPGLASIAYRIGTHPEFFDRMQWQLPRHNVNGEDEPPLFPLAALRARAAGDPTIALFDGFAATLDVLSFYSERVANEAYLGTATQRRALVEMARMIGYEPAPGVAASVALSFTVEASDDPYRAVEIPVGVQAMSVPTRKGELPQVFETTQPITARAEWNAMPARTLYDQPLALFHDGDDAGNGGIFLFDLDNSFGEAALGDPDLRIFDTIASLAPYHPLDGETDLVRALEQRIEAHALNAEVEPLLRALPVDEIYLRGTGLGLKAGQRIVVIGVALPGGGPRKVAASTLRVVSASDDREFGVTRLVATRGGEPPAAVRSAPVRRSPRFKRIGMPTARLAFTSDTVTNVVRQAVWTGPALTALVRSQSWSRAKLMHLVRRPRPVEVPETSDARPGLYILRDDCGFFGASAPPQEMLGDNKGPYPKPWDADPVDPNADPRGAHGDGAPEDRTDRDRPRRIWTDSQGMLLSGNHIYLEREVKDILPDGWVVIETGDGEAMVFRVAAAATHSRADYALTAKTTALKLRAAPGADDLLNPPEADDTSPLNAFTFRTAHIFAASAPLELAGTPIRDDVRAGADAIDLDALYLDLVDGQTISIAGERSDADGLAASETLKVRDVVHIGGFTRLLLESGPEYAYRRASVTVNANMAAATHGEGYEEPLGSGDAAQGFQRFKLAKAPLTYVSAETATGRASSLAIRVDGILWHEVPTLYDAGPDDRVYAVRCEDDASTWVQFGDGVRGSRLPTGQLNIVARYRAGIGLAGEVADEAIIQLKTRPLGIRAVVNPSRASGSAAPESLAEIRLAAPRDVKTLDRIVSLVDYRDFAANFAGVGKAQAARLWSGDKQVIIVSITGTSDAILDANAAVIENLLAAADAARDRSHGLFILPAARRFFELRAKLFHHPDHRPEDVELAARDTLLEMFGFARRDIGQVVSAAEVIAALQSVPGVVGVDLDALALIDESGGASVQGADLAAVLPVEGARLDGATPAAAELLTLLDAGVALTVEMARA
ncbi:putative baseplate assembly protein [Sphingopyxis sp. YF1]|uniref:putative baseplate assembly protein n=1 Tax=Sphingopyxis sp. YF1 TaxID=2482763 RepID=UPI001F60DA76|nr:putative baseplate assembly protein [Sphingopyxis sp. YF1]UNU42352.1 putative baseplate assembly protein [Sphingopyxis sp. YF1]